METTETCKNCPLYNSTEKTWTQTPDLTIAITYPLFMFYKGKISMEDMVHCFKRLSTKKVFDSYG